MKVLHIYKTEPDEAVQTLARAWNDGNEVTEFHLHQTPVDYERLIDLIFENDNVLSWF